MRHASWAFALLAAASAVACQSLPGTVRDTYERDVTCPAERTAVVQLDTRPPSCGVEEPPPREIAADPERRALWEAQRAEAREDCARWSVWEATGCGHTIRYECRRQTKGRSWCVRIPDDPAQTRP